MLGRDGRGDGKLRRITVANGELKICEKVISKERVTIGRRAHNDVVINDPAISSEHAVITICANGDSLLEDLDSTNGTKVNGQPVRKHFLQDNDVIELAHYTLHYANPARNDCGSEGMCNGGSTQGRPSSACIRILNGSSAGKQISLDKQLVTVGKPEEHTAMILSRSDGYFIAHIAGNMFPRVNGKAIGLHEHPVLHNDLIDVGGTEMRFLLS